MYWSKSASRSTEPSRQKIPTIRTSRGTSWVSRVASIGSIAKKPKSMKAVAFVGPRMVWREPAKIGATSDAVAEQAMPKTIGSSAMAA